MKGNKTYALAVDRVHMEPCVFGAKNTPFHATLAKYLKARAGKAVSSKPAASLAGK
jgi:hypothetical protein